MFSAAPTRWEDVDDDPMTLPLAGYHRRRSSLAPVGLSINRYSSTKSPSSLAASPLGGTSSTNGMGNGGLLSSSSPSALQILEESSDPLDVNHEGWIEAIENATRSLEAAEAAVFAVHSAPNHTHNSTITTTNVTTGDPPQSTSTVTTSKQQQQQVGLLSIPPPNTSGNNNLLDTSPRSARSTSSPRRPESMNRGRSPSSNDGRGEEDNGIQDSDLEQSEVHTLKKARKALDALLPSSPDFDPALFLSTVHSSSSDDDLHRGRDKVGSIIQERENHLRAIVNKNLDSFILSKDTVESVYQQIQDQENTGQGTRDVEQTILAAQESATKAFQPLLERQARLDQMRNVLAVLRRFNYVFSIAGDIKAAIRRSDFDRVIREAKKAKEHDELRAYPIFAQVLHEISTLVQEFQEKLLEMLTNHKLRSEEQERVIGYLIQLESKVDPVWYCFGQQGAHLNSLLERCTKQYELRLATIKGRKTLAPSSSNPGPPSSNSGPDTHHDRHTESTPSPAQLHEKELLSLPSGGSGDTGGTGAGSGGSGSADLLSGSSGSSNIDNLSGAYTKRLTSLMLTYIPPLWKFAKGILNGKWRHRDGASTMGSGGRSGGPNAFSGSIGRSFGGGAGSLTRGSTVQDRVREFFVRIFELYGKKILSGLPRKDLARHSFVLTTVLDLVDATKTLRSLGLPASYLLGIEYNVSEIVKDYINDRNASLLEDVAVSFHAELTAASEDAAAGAASSTMYASGFAQTVCAWLAEVSDIVSDGHQLVDGIASTFFNASKVFMDCLHELSLDDTRLLRTLRLATYTKESVLPDLLRRFRLAFRTASTTEHDHVLSLMKTLEDVVLNRYITKCTVALNRPVHVGLFYSGLAWEAVRLPPNYEIPSHVLEVLLTLVVIHNEVFSTAPAYARRVLVPLTTNIAMAYSDAFRIIDNVSSSGALLATMELEFILSVLALYKDHTEHHLLALYKSLDRGLNLGQNGASDGLEGQSSVATLGAAMFTPQERQWKRESLESWKHMSRLQFECFR